MSVNATAAPGGLREQRRAAGLSQQDLAQRAGCSISYVRVLEQGFAPDRSDVLPRILNALNNGETGTEPEANNGEDPADNRVFAKERDDGAHHGP